MTTTAELDLYQDAAPAPALRVPALPDLPDVDSWIRAMASIAKLADQICDTDFVPKEMRRNPAAVTACILTGREFGWGPMLALRAIYVSNGTPGLYAKTKRAMILAAGHEFRVLEWDGKRCKIAARRKGDRGEPLVVEYTMADAEMAGLPKRNANYHTSPRSMLLARATTLVDSAMFTDVTNGMATAELLGDADVMAEVSASHIEVPAIAPPPVADLKARAAAQTATAVTQEPSPAAPDATTSAAPPPPSAPAAGEARTYKQDKDLIKAKLDQLGVTDEAGQLRVAARIARLGELKSFDRLPPAMAAAVALAVEGLEENTELAALLDDIAAENAEAVPDGA